MRCSDAEIDKQKGFVNDVEVVADVRILGTNQVICRVDCRELEPLQVSGRPYKSQSRWKQTSHVNFVYSV